MPPSRRTTYDRSSSGRLEGQILEQDRPYPAASQPIRLPATPEIQVVEPRCHQPWSPEVEQQSVHDLASARQRSSTRSFCVLETFWRLVRFEEGVFQHFGGVSISWIVSGGCLPHVQDPVEKHGRTMPDLINRRPSGW